MARAELGIGSTRYSAILRAMGWKGRRFVKVSLMRKWLDEHPGFREGDVYLRVKVSGAGIQIQSSASVQSDKSSVRK